MSYNIILIAAIPVAQYALRIIPAVIGTSPNAPAYATGKMAGKTKRRDFTGQLLSCRFYPAQRVEHCHLK
jgi:hypothetical protein